MIENMGKGGELVEVGGVGAFGLAESNTEGVSLEDLKFMEEERSGCQPGCKSEGE